MSEQEINIAIAESCGWRPDKRGLGWLSPHGYYAPEPDYCNDLNAMHETEKILTEEQCAFFRVHLRERLEDHPASRYLWHATARQRAEAFLRTLGKWEGTKC